MSHSKTPKFKFSKKIIIPSIFLLLIAILVVIIKGCISEKKDVFAPTDTAQATYRDVTATITGTAVVAPKDQYSVTSLITGEIVSAEFEEGDNVKKGDVLYRIDASDIEKDIKSAELALNKARQNYNDAIKAKDKNSKANQKNLESSDLGVKKAQQSYDDAVKSKNQTGKANQKNLESAKIALEKAQQNYNDAQKAINDLVVISPISGNLGELYVKEGDNVSAGMNIARVYDSSNLQIKIPFNEDDALKITPGEAAVLSLIGSGETLNGIVTAVDSASQIKDAHMKIRYVTIKITTPGALSPSDKATASIGTLYCNDAGTFEYFEEKIITAKTSGTVKEINIKAGNYVQTGSAIVTLENESLESQLSTAALAVKDAELAHSKAKDALGDHTSAAQVENAKLALEDAQIARSKANDNMDDYSSDSQIQNAKLALEDAQIALEKIKSASDDYVITSPISGQIVTKNSKLGDKVDSINKTEAMAVIYDMSALEFDINIDELDINKVSLEQEVIITADALNGKEYKGYISNISINGTEANGVTSYPVSVSITDFDEDLLPGMNIDVEITVSKAENVLTIPKSAVTRDNIVYVAGEKDNPDDTAPEGYKSVKVETGLNDTAFIEIISGLAEGDVVKAEASPSSNTNIMMPGMGMHGGGMPAGNMPAGGGMQR